ncbi:MAG: hypothetical protein H7249_14355 [Chitinophagaceae bacterium]|nr:hypothetical protein [Oligoflexus sp.]
MIVEIDRGLQDVLPRYIRGRQEDLGYLQLALGRKDYPAIEKISKRVAGTAPTYGMTVLGEISNELIGHAAEHRQAECEELLVKMRDFLSTVKPKFV